MVLDRVLFASGRDNWKTPKEIYDRLNQEFHFTFDPCPPKPLTNGLKISWKTRNFINPPFSQVAQWIVKALEESHKGKLCVLLTAARTDTRWFHNCVLPFAKEIRFIKGRLHFDGSKNSAPFPSMIVVFDGRPRSTRLIIADTGNKTTLSLRRKQL